MAKTFKALLNEAYSAASEAFKANSDAGISRAVRRNGACVREVARRTTNFYTACEAFKASVQFSFGADVTLRRAVALITRPSQVTYLRKCDVGNDIDEILSSPDFGAHALDKKEEQFFRQRLRRAATVREYFVALYNPHVGKDRMYEDLGLPTEEEIMAALALVRSVEDVAYIYKYHVHEDNLLTQVMVLDVWGALVRTPQERRRLARVVRQAEQGKKGRWPQGQGARPHLYLQGRQDDWVLIISEPGVPVDE